MTNRDAAIVDREIVENFIAESKKMMGAVEPHVQELLHFNESEESLDNSVLNFIFRVFNFLKENAGFLHYDKLSKVTHRAETLLGCLRDGALTL